VTASPTILIGTGNREKIREIRAALNGLPVTLRTLDDFPKIPDPVEDRESFADNAAVKAVHFSLRTGVWALADDSGLEVDALEGAPGVRSARYAGPDVHDAANNRKLIDALRDVPVARRTARYCCALALANGDRILATAYGTVDGLIIDQPRGDNGFGYDPHFLIPHLGVTAAELPLIRKNEISHRGSALAQMRARLLDLVRGGS